MREYLGSSSCRLKTSTILWMSWWRRRFLLPSFTKPLLASIMKMPVRVGGVFLVEHDDAGRDAGAVEEVGGQADDALDVAPADDVLADFAPRRCRGRARRGAG